MAKRKARPSDLPACLNIECHGVGLRTKDKQRNLIWTCSVCGQTWERERMLD